MMVVLGVCSIGEMRADSHTWSDMAPLGSKSAVGSGSSLSRGFIVAGLCSESTVGSVMWSDEVCAAGASGSGYSLLSQLM